MTHRAIDTAVCLMILMIMAAPTVASRQMENLTRGVVAVKLAEGGVYVGWRLLQTDPPAAAVILCAVLVGKAGISGPGC